MSYISNRILTTSRAILIALSVGLGSVAEANDQDIVEAGDVLQIVLPLGALGSTFLTDDKEGRWQFTKSFGAGWLTTRVLKVVVGKTRPNSGNQESFPSGHTFGAFSGAAFIDTRYGHLWGIPSYIAAAFVGASRVVGDAHYLDDVIAGGSIAMFSNWAYATPFYSPVTVTPAMFAGDGVGVQVHLADAGNKTPIGGTYAESEKRRYPQWRYSLAMGPAFLNKNEIRAPRGSGTSFDLNSFSKNDDPVTTAAGILEVDLDGRNELMLMAQPFEARDRGQFNNPVSFGGKTFPAGTDIRSRYLKYDVAGRWRYNLAPEGPWGAKLGAGINAQIVEVELATESRTVGAEVKDYSVLPYLSGELSYQFTPKVDGLVYVEGITISSDLLLDTGVAVGYRFNEHWDASLGYTYYKRQIDIDELRNDAIYNIIVASLGYSF